MQGRTFLKSAGGPQTVTKRNLYDAIGTTTGGTDSKPHINAKKVEDVDDKPYGVSNRTSVEDLLKKGPQNNDAYTDFLNNGKRGLR